MVTETLDHLDVEIEGSGASIHSHLGCLVVVRGDIAKIWMVLMKAPLAGLPGSLVPCKVSKVLSTEVSSWPHKLFQEFM